MNKADIVRAATDRFDTGEFERRLTHAVSIRSTSQDPAFTAEVKRYLTEFMIPWLDGMGFVCRVHPNPREGFGPILTAERIEDPSLLTVISYGHGDTVRGMEEQWTEGRDPWTLRREDDRWYGRGTADNKGQHICNLFALEAVLAQREGKLGFNVKLVLEMAEERGSAGLAQFVQENANLLAADVFIASDGPRVSPEALTISGGTRGNFQFDLVVKARQGGVHSGHWGGLTTDPAILISHALACICDHKGHISIPEWLPGGGRSIDPELRAMLADCPVDDGGDAAEIDADWGQPGLTAAEKRYAWNSFIVRATSSGRPDSPQNAVAPTAWAACEIRYVPEMDPSNFITALRAHLDQHGLQSVRIENATIRMPASASLTGSSWLEWVEKSVKGSISGPVQIIPNISGGMPGQAFIEHLAVPTIWIPHGHNGCKQHGPDEHMLVGVAREAVMAFAGIWYDLGSAERPVSIPGKGNVQPLAASYSQKAQSFVKSLIKRVLAFTIGSHSRGHGKRWHILDRMRVLFLNSVAVCLGSLLIMDIHRSWELFGVDSIGIMTGLCLATVIDMNEALRGDHAIMSPTQRRVFWCVVGILGLLIALGLIDIGLLSADKKPLTLAMGGVTMLVIGIICCFVGEIMIGIIQARVQDRKKSPSARQ